VKSPIYKREVIAARDFPNLSWRWIDDKPVLAGKYHFSGERDGVELSGDFHLRLEFPQEYPDLLPVVYEDGQTIPSQYHRNPDTALCLGTPAELHVLFSKSPCLKTFMTEIVNPYLYRWLAFSRGDTLWEDRSHGVDGLLEGYRDLLGLKNTSLVRDSLLFILTHHRDYRSNLPCPCGSGEKTKQCHRKRFDWLVDRVPEDVLRTDFITITAVQGRKK